MNVTINIGALGHSRWYEYLLRFVFGCLVTALTGIIAKRWGPEVGGLFLAFPAIFPQLPLCLRSTKGRRRSERESKAFFGRGRSQESTQPEQPWGALAS